MKTLFILNDQPYGNERSYNGLRLIGALAKLGTEEIRVFLLGDAAACAKDGQNTPEGFYNIANMIKIPARKGVEFGVCGTCMDARGITEAELLDVTRRSTLLEMAEWTRWAEKVIVF
jgi:uncharacterized protein involved in oxidation of intracellular sulfur